MIIGTCPYEGCEGRVWEAIADLPLPKYQKHICEECKRVIWTKHSRIDPCSWTEENFLKEYRVNKKTRIIELRKKPKKLTKKQLLHKALLEEAFRKWYMNMMIYGVGIIEDKK